MRHDEAAVQSIVGDEFHQGLPELLLEDEVVQFDDREHGLDCVIGPDPYPHLAFNRQARKVREVKRVATVPHLAFEKAAADRSLHDELLHGPRSRTANFVTNKAIAGGDTERGNGVLQLIRTSDFQDKTGV